MNEGFHPAMHWRMKNLRYRLEGVRAQQGEVQLNNRPTGKKIDSKSDTQVSGETNALVVDGVLLKRLAK